MPPNLRRLKTNWRIPNSNSAENKEKLTALLAQQVEVKKALEEVEMDWLAAQEELEAMLQA